MSDNIVKISKFKKKAKSHVGFLSFLLIIAIICFFLMSPIFEIEDITVFGNVHLSSEEIIEVSGIAFGNNIFKLDKILALKNISKIPYIKNVTVKRVWPGNIKISVEEKEPIAEVEFYGAKLLLDEDGYIVDVITSESEQIFTIICGLHANNIETGQLLICDESKKLECYLEVLKILKNNDMLNKVVKVEKNENILLYMEYGHVVNFGDEDNLLYKVLLLKEILPKETNSSYIDLSNLEMKTTRPVWGMFNSEEVSEDETRGEKVEE